MLPTLIASLFSKSRKRRCRGVAKTRRRLVIEDLEGRRLLATYNWVLQSDGDFAVASNWQNTSTGLPGVPGAADFATVNNAYVVTSSASRTLGGFSGGGLRVSAGTFTLSNSVSDSFIVRLTVDSGASLQTTGKTTAVIGTEIFGTIDTLSGATFRFERGLNNLNTGATLIGAGQYTLLGDVFGGPEVSINSNISAPTNMVFANGIISGAGILTISSPFEWKTGTMQGVGQTVITSTGVVSMTQSDANIAQRSFNNSGVIRFQTKNGNLNLSAGATVNNLPGGVIDLQSNFSISGGTTGTINNAGTIQRTVGSGTTRIGVFLNNTSSINVQTGTLALALGTSNNGTFATAAGTTLDLCNGGSIQIGGTTNFTGSGTVLWGNGTLSTPQANSTWNIPLSVSMLWTSNVTVVPVGFIWSINGNVNFAGSFDTQLRGGGRLKMNGNLTQSGIGNIVISGDIQTNTIATTLEIPATRQYILQSDSGILVSSNSGNLVNAGMIVKSGGNGTSTIGVPLSNSGNISVTSGILALSNTSHSAGSYYVTSGKVLQLNANNSSQFLLSGPLNLNGYGTFSLQVGTFKSSPSGSSINVSATTNLLWTGGFIHVPLNATMTINGTTKIQGTGTATLLGGGTLVLNGATAQSQSSIFRLEGNGVSAPSTLRIPVGASYNLSDDASLINGNNGGGIVDNIGLIKKPVGGGTSLISTPLQRAANFQVDSGVLSLGMLNSTVLGGVWTVASGAVLDLISGNIAINFFGTFTGSGAGQIQLNRGTLTGNSGPSGTTFNFPSGLFRLVGGAINTNSAIMTIAGNVSYVGASDFYVGGNGILKITGIFDHQSTGTIFLQGPTTLNVASTGIVNLQRDSAIAGGVLDNDGIVRKIAGTGLTNIGSRVSNQGTVESRVGTISFTGPIDEIVTGNLTGGVWNVLTVSPNSAAINFNTNINSIGTAATVLVYGTGASCPSLGSLTSVAGNLTVYSGASLSTTGNLANTGRITIGAGSAMTITGNYSQPASGKLSIVVSGAAGGKLRVTGAINLTGSLTMSLSGALPAVGTVLTLLENLGPGPISGNFAGLAQNANINFGGMNWTIRYNQGPNSNSVTITRVS